MRKTKIINVFGGPGAGKSTSAAFLYFQLKVQGLNAELVREYVKDWAWEGRHISVNDQIYFLGKQVRRESMLHGKVDWIVTDSPVWMNSFYASHYCTEIISSGVDSLVKAFYQQVADEGYEYINVLLTRNSPYQAEGRFQTEQQAKDIDVGVKEMLLKHSIPFIECNADNSDLLALLSKITAS